MDKNIVLAVIFGAAAVVGAMETVYQIYRLTVMDAAARGLKHPKLWGLLAANGNNSSGLLLYLIGRRNYPVNSIDSRQLVVMEKRKKAAGIGLVFDVCLHFPFVLSEFPLYKPYKPTLPKHTSNPIAPTATNTNPIHQNALA